MNTALWIVQILLAVLFVLTGLQKAARPKEKLPEMFAWKEDFSQGSLRLFGILELLGALGLILPGITGILPILTPWAAVGLALIQGGAIYTHLRRKETSVVWFNFILLALLIFVAYGRFVIVPL